MPPLNSTTKRGGKSREEAASVEAPTVTREKGGDGITILQSVLSALTVPLFRGPLCLDRLSEVDYNKSTLKEPSAGRGEKSVFFQPLLKGRKALQMAVGMALLVLWRGVLPAAAALTVEDLKPGMKGIGKTVFQGTTIETFDFEIIDVMYVEGYLSDMILVKVSGPKIDEIGGICAGMSGSPLYIGDQLIGAIAFTSPMSDTRYGFATPLEDMLKVLEMDRGPADAPASEAEKELEAPAEKAPEAPPTEQVPALSGLLLFPETGPRLAAGGPLPLHQWLPVQTPIMVSGLRGRPFQVLARRLKRWNWWAVETGTPGSPVSAEEVVLEPGSAVGLSLAAGDVAITALGTLTYRAGEKVLAFGHPFLQRGETSLFLSPAYIYQVVKSLDMPFKVGAPLGDPVGVITQDRSAAVGGRLNRTADHFKLQIHIEDRDLRRNRTMSVKVVRDTAIAPSIVATAVLQALDETLDRIGCGTAELRWMMIGSGLDRPVERDDLIFHEDDISGEVISGLLLSTERLLQNEFREIVLETVEVQVAVESARRTARIQHLEVTPLIVRPGQTVQLQVTLQPYRGTAERKTLSLKIPEDLVEDTVLIELHGQQVEVHLTAEGNLLVAAELEKLPAPTFTELIADLEEANKGNTLVAEVVTGRRPEADVLPRGGVVRPELNEVPGAAEGPPSPLLTMPKENARQVRAKAQLDTAYVIQGRAEKRLKVVAQTAIKEP